MTVCGRNKYNVYVTRVLRILRRTVLVGSILLVVSTGFLGVIAMALVYWYRDCDPLLSGVISKIEQVPAACRILCLLWLRQRTVKTRITTTQS